MEEIFEIIEQTTFYPDDLDYDYEQWLEEKSAMGEAISFGK